MVKQTLDSKTTDWLWAKLDNFLSEKKLKQTRQRQVIVQGFLEMSGHLSAEELHEYIRNQGHNIGLATIYRTLNLLKEAGLADQKQFADGKSVFEVLSPGHHHDHLICLSCRKIIEFENEEIEKLQDKVALLHNFELVSHSLDLFGYCESCKQSPASSPSI